MMRSNSLASFQVGRCGYSLICSLSCFLLFCGCSPANTRSYAIYPVDGQLFVGAEPAEGAMVIFHPEEGGDNELSYTAMVREDGHFVPTQQDGGVGLPEGNYVLTATWVEDGVDRFDGKYADPAEPIAIVKVTSGINLLTPIQLPSLSN